MNVEVQAAWSPSGSHTKQETYMSTHMQRSLFGVELPQQNAQMQSSGTFFFLARKLGSAQVPSSIIGLMGTAKAKRSIMTKAAQDHSTPSPKLPRKGGRIKPAQCESGLRAQVIQQLTSTKQGNATAKATTSEAQAKLRLMLNSQAGKLARRLAQKPRSTS